MKIVVVPATYNEKENIKKFIPILEEEIFPKIKKHQMYILVADDNSPDGTGDVIKSFMKKYKNLGINQGEKKGLGAAYIRTMGEAVDKMGADAVISVDADFQHDLSKIPDFVKKLEEGYDMVIGTRYSDGGSIPENWPPQRKLFSIVANLFVRTVFMRFSIHDWTGGFRAISRKVFLKERPEMEGYNGYIFQIAFLNKAVRDGFTVAEVPFHFSDRTLGSSKIAPLAYIIDVVTFVIVQRILEFKRFIKFLFVGGTGFLVQVLTQELSVYMGIPHAISAGVGAESAILTNFFFNNNWTFKDTKKIHDNLFTKLIKFNVASFGAIIIQSSAVWIGEKLLGVSTVLFSHSFPTRIVVLFPAIIFLVIPLNYLIYNRIIWKTHQLKTKTPMSS